MLVPTLVCVCLCVWLHSINVLSKTKSAAACGKWQVACGNLLQPATRRSPHSHPCGSAQTTNYDKLQLQTASFLSEFSENERMKQEEPHIKHNNNNARENSLRLRIIWIHYNFILLNCCPNSAWIKEKFVEFVVAYIASKESQKCWGGSTLWILWNSWNLVFIDWGKRKRVWPQSKTNLICVHYLVFCHKDLLP